MLYLQYMCIYKKVKIKMGDLKKEKTRKNFDFMTYNRVDKDEGEKILDDHGYEYQNEEVIERLSGYIQKFYKNQIDKMEKEEQKNSKN